MTDDGFISVTDHDIFVRACISHQAIKDKDFKDPHDMMVLMFVIGMYHPHS